MREPAGMARYYEDYAVGDRHETPGVTITEVEIIAFAEAYDPQPFHTDPEAAKNSLFGGLVASGWQTAAIAMRSIVESRVMEATGVVGIGIDELRWLSPVRAGDTLHVSMEIVDKQPSLSGKRRGVIRSRILVRNQRGEDVMSEIAINTIAFRPERTS